VRGALKPVTVALGLAGALALGAGLLPILQPDPEADLEDALAAWDRGDTARALHRLERTPAKPGSVAAGARDLALGTLLASRNEDAPARSYLRRASASSEPRVRGDAAYNLALLIHRAGRGGRDLEEARELLRTALRLEPGRRDAVALWALLASASRSLRSRSDPLAGAFSGDLAPPVSLSGDSGSAGVLPRAGEVLPKTGSLDKGKAQRIRAPKEGDPPW